MQEQDMRQLAKELKDNLSRLQNKRSTWESHWQEVADFCLPRKADVNVERSRGDKRNIQIFDATAVHSLELLASSLQGMLTSSANRWFQLRYKEAVLKAVNLGEDTDTTGAVVGGLAGLFYGMKSIPNEWIDEIARKEDIEELTNKLSDKYKIARC